MNKVTFLLVAASATTLVACGGSSSGGGAPQAISASAEVEPNDTTETAAAFTQKDAAAGNVDATGDSDFWEVALKAGDVVNFKMRASTLDPDWWDNDNTARLSLMGTDGLTTLLTHQLSSGNAGGLLSASAGGPSNWSFGRGDVDVPAFHVPETGNYFVSLGQQDNTDGGDYVLQVERDNSFGSITTEIEGPDEHTNNSFETAEAITPGTTLGYHGPQQAPTEGLGGGGSGDPDFYSFAVTQPSIVRFEVTAYRNGILNGTDYFDPQLYLYDDQGEELMEVNDSMAYDPCIDYLINTPGTYYLRVNDDGNPAGEGNYLLTYERINAPSSSNEAEPNDSFEMARAVGFNQVIRGDTSDQSSDYFSFQGNAGDRVLVYIYDQVNSEFGSYIYPDFYSEVEGEEEQPIIQSSNYDFFENNFPIASIILQSTGKHYIELQDKGTSDYAMQIRKVGSAAYEVEPNNDDEEAHTIQKGKSWAGVMDTPSDVDVFAFTAKQDFIYEFALYATTDSHYYYDVAGGGNSLADDFSGWGSDLFGQMRILDADGNQLNHIDTGNSSQTSQVVTNPTASATIAFLAPADGTFYVEVGDTDACIAQSAVGCDQSDRYYVIEYR